MRRLIGLAETAVNSRRMLDGLFGLKVSQGAIANMLARAARPFATEARRIEAEVRAAPVIACDELVAALGDAFGELAAGGGVGLAPATLGRSSGCRPKVTAALHCGSNSSPHWHVYF